MNVKSLLNELYKMVNKAWSFSLAGGKAMLDGKAVKGVLDEIHDNPP